MYSNLAVHVYHYGADRNQLRINPMASHRSNWFKRHGTDYSKFMAYHRRGTVSCWDSFKHTTSFI